MISVRNDMGKRDSTPSADGPPRNVLDEMLVAALLDFEDGAPIATVGRAATVFAIAMLEASGERGCAFAALRLRARPAASDEALGLASEAYIAADAGLSTVKRAALRGAADRLAASGDASLASAIMLLRQLADEEGT